MLGKYYHIMMEFFTRCGFNPEETSKVANDLNEMVSNLPENKKLAGKNTIKSIVYPLCSQLERSIQQKMEIKILNDRLKITETEGNSSRNKIELLEVELLDFKQDQRALKRIINVLQEQMEEEKFEYEVADQKNKAEIKLLKRRYNQLAEEHKLTILEDELMAPIKKQRLGQSSQLSSDDEF